MSEPVTVAELKAELRLDPDETGQDARLQLLLLAARRAVEHRINRPLIGPDVTFGPDDLTVARQAVILIATNWFEGAEDGDMPRGVVWLLAPLRNWAG